MHLIDLSPEGLPGSGGPDEIEALQTDVMRFLAILCLCLMVIFALVQSLPVAAPPAAPQLADPTALIRRIQELHRQIERLQVQRQSLAQQISERQKDRQAMDRAVQTARDQLDALQQALATAGRQAAELDRKIQLQHHRLHAGHVQRRHLEADVTRQQQQLNEIQRKMDTITSSPAPAAPAATPIPDVTTPDAAAVPPSPTGFALQFESPTVLTRLVGNGKVGLFALIGDSAWQLIAVASQHIRAMRQQRPTVYYEMAAHTVPGVFSDALRASVAAFGPAAVQWAVVLPPEIRLKIERIMATHQTGRIVIGPLGTVRLETVDT